MKRVLFIIKGKSVFALKDEAYFKSFFDVVRVNQEGAIGYKVILYMIWQFFYFLRNTKKADYLFITFADYHSLVPVFLGKIFKKPSYIVIGGSDATYIPEINYGVFSNFFRSFCATYSIKNADYLLPVDISLKHKIDKRIPVINGQWEVVPNGYSSQFWYCDTPKEDIVLTVGAFTDYQRMRVKGLDFFLEVAKAMPHRQFVHIGVTESGEKLLKDVPDNLLLLPPMSTIDIREYCSRAKVYAQFSITEGMPNAVSEAMLCECVLVGTDVGAMKTLAGDIGYIIADQNLEAAKACIEDAFKNYEAKGKPSREHIANNFTFVQRMDRIMNIMPE